MSTAEPIGLPALTDRHQVVCLIGPPAVGKSTVAAALARRDRAEVFRLRAHVDATDLARTRTTARRVGWLADDIVREALADFFASLDRSRPALAVMDNFPGRGTQVGMLSSIAGLALGDGVQIEVVELAADALLIQEWARERLACPGCESDVLGDPRLAATESSPGSGRCARCGCPLHHRPGDAPDVLARRTQRYHANADRTRLACLAAGIPVATVDAARPLAAVVDHVARTIHVR